MAVGNLLPQEHGLGHLYVPPKPKPFNPSQSTAFQQAHGPAIPSAVNPIHTVAPAAAPPPAPVAPPAPAPPPIDWEAQVRNDPEGALQHTYLDRQNTLTTDALRKAWLQHTQSAADSFNAHGGLFSGAQQQARENNATDYKTQSAQQQLDYDKGGHDINTSVLHRLMLQLTGVDNGMGK